MLAGVSERVARQLDKTRAVSVIGGERIFRATRAVTESTRQAITAAEVPWPVAQPLPCPKMNAIRARQPTDAILDTIHQLTLEAP
jgi:hypothetical protein